MSRGDLKIQGARAVVTGAGSGIGRSLAIELAHRGAAEVVVTDVDGDRASSVAAEVSALGADARSLVLDVTDADAVEVLAEDLFSDGKPVTILCNNAGIGHAGPVAETPLEDWRRVIEVNLMGVVHGVSAFVPRMVAAGRPAHIINTASMAGLVATANMAPYSATKFAVVGLSEAMSLELEPKNIGVTALCPGFIDTDIVNTSTMRGEMAERQEGFKRFYSTRGTSPDVVARQALDTVGGRGGITPTPRYQVTPAWLMARYAPPLSRAVSRLTIKRLGR